MTESFDAIALGAGEAGSLVASLAVEAGHRVAMVYRPPYGSTCLNTGCVPSKFMIHRARVAHLTRTAARFHVTTSEPRVDLAGIVREKNEVVAAHREESFRNARAAESLTLLEGPARFASPHEVVVGDRRLASDRIFIASSRISVRKKSPTSARSSSAPSSTRASTSSSNTPPSASKRLVPGSA